MTLERLIWKRIEAAESEVSRRLVPHGWSLKELDPIFYIMHLLWVQLYAPRGFPYLWSPTPSQHNCDDIFGGIFSKLIKGLRSCRRKDKTVFSGWVVLPVFSELIFMCKSDGVSLNIHWLVQNEVLMWNIYTYQYFRCWIRTAASAGDMLVIGRINDICTGH